MMKWKIAMQAMNANPADLISSNDKIHEQRMSACGNIFA
jgi:hypothetical protein